MRLMRGSLLFSMKFQLKSEIDKIRPLNLQNVVISLIIGE